LSIEISQNISNFIKYLDSKTEKWLICWMVKFFNLSILQSLNY
jgi:hypothetical protein